MEEGIVVSPLDLTKALRDVVSCDTYEEACARLNIVPPGPDVDEAEHSASHRRARRLQPVLPQVLVKSVAAADAFYLTQILSAGDKVNPDDQHMIRQVVLRGVISSLGQLAEEGDIVFVPQPPLPSHLRRPSA